MTRQDSKTRLLALTMAVLMTAGAALPVSAAPIDSGVTPTYDEAYYATLDYYGNLMEGSVVKSYALNGASSFTDYGAYDEVVNLTDGTQPSLSEGSAAFQFDQAPGHFYFEGKTAQPFQDLPWTITLRYTLNGVPVQAEELAGKTGVVEILLDLVPNEKASDYARYNYTLEAMAVFNQDDILSLEAPGAQVQLVGNLRAVLFIALPGEEQHFTIRVGSDDFSFGGMTFLMVPATLSQLEEIAKLSQRKDELEEDYEALSGSLDTLLDALNDVQSGLYASANGLDQLDIARGTISSGKGTIYAGAGVVRGDLTGIADLLDPVAERAQALSQTVAESKTVLGEMTDTTVSLKTQLDEMEKALKELEDGTKDIKGFMQDAANLEDSLRRLERALDRVKVPSSSSGSSGSIKVGDMPDLVAALDAAYGANSRTAFLTYMLTVQKQSDAAAKAGQMDALLTGYETALAAVKAQAEAAGTPLDDETAHQMAVQILAGQVGEDAVKVLPDALKLDGLYQAKGQMDFQTFCSTVLQSQGYSKKEADELAGLMVSLNTIMNSDNPADKAQLDLILASIEKVSGELSGTSSQVNSALTDVTRPTADVVGELAELCEELDDLTGLLDDAKDLSAALREAAPKLNSILDRVDQLRVTLDGYEPTLQESLANVGQMSTAASATLRDMEQLLGDTEALMQTSGQQLDTATQQTLRGLSDALRKTAQAMAATGDVRDAKTTITDIIEDTWNEYTGDVNNILMMDAGAEPVSLTDRRNPAPTSVQILIRTQEIKADEAEETIAETAAVKETTTFWDRVVQMFRDFWKAVTGIFH